MDAVMAEAGGSGIARKMGSKRREVHTILSCMADLYRAIFSPFLLESTGNTYVIIITDLFIDKLSDVLSST
jgi:hypothetical protein